MNKEIEFKYIPEEYWPSLDANVIYDEVYRGCKSLDKLSKDDFIPWIFEYKNQISTFKKKKSSYYGVSLFSDINSLREKISHAIEIKTIAKGFTSINRGVSLPKNKYNHIEYFLFDYKDNNCYEDFKIVCPK